MLTDTAELHFRSWLELAGELRVPFDRDANHALRGLGRRESLERLLGARSGELTDEQKHAIAQRKNQRYLELAADLSPADLLPGARELLDELRRDGWRTAVASSSRNAEFVIARLEIRHLLDAIVDGNSAPRSKPDPLVFELAARMLAVPAERCVVIEDAASGIAAARTAGMRVVGVGAPAQLAGADLIVDSLRGLCAATLRGLIRAPGAPTGGAKISGGLP